MASLDTRRPAAQEQLRQLGEQTGVATLPIIEGQSPVILPNAPVQAAKLGGHDVVILDTAGRTHIDEPLMAEMAEIKARQSARDLLVADALTGQDAVNLARNFDERVGISGLVLTRMDGDGRGGAALSMRAVTGKPIKLIGTGEKMDALEEFHPRASPTASSAWATSSRWSRRRPRPSTPKRRRRWRPDAGRQVRPERSGRPARADAEDGRHGRHHGHDAGHGQDEGPDGGGRHGRQDLRPPARHHPVDDQGRARQSRHLKHSRKKRIAAGSGTDAADINKLLKMHRQMADMMKAMKGKKGGGMMGKMMGGLAGKMGLPGGMGGMGGMPDLSKMEPEGARGAAEAGGGRRPRQGPGNGRHAWRASGWNAGRLARTGWAEAARSWRRRPSRPAEEEVRAAHEHQ
jgi:signal recognition particle subunit SRP54